MTQDQIDEVKRQVVGMICSSKELGATSTRRDCQALERLQDEKLNELFKAFSTYMGGLRKSPLALYQRDTIKANAWKDTRDGGYYDANEIISATERAHGIGEPPCEQPS